MPIGRPRFDGAGPMSAPPPIQIRACDDRDLATLRLRWPTADDVHGAHYTEHHKATATYLVAWQDQEPLGSALVQWQGPVGIDARAAFPGGVEVNHLHVRETYRRRGVATLLLAAAEQLMQERGRLLSAVSVELGNADATRLYRRLGYTATGMLDVSAYDWTDEQGQRHHEVETNEFLIKPLSSAAPATDDSKPPEGHFR